MGRAGTGFQLVPLALNGPKGKLQVERVGNDSQQFGTKIVPLVIPPGFADIALELRAQGDPDPWYVTFGVDISESGGDVEEIAAGMLSAWEPVMGAISTIVNCTGVKLAIGQDGDPPVRAFITPVGGMNGGQSAQVLPQNCALLVRKNTAIGGRRAKGRFFVPACLTEAEVDNIGAISNGLMASLSNPLGTFFESLEDATPPTPMVVLHNDEGVSPIIDPTLVTSLSLDNVISTQRRRLR